MEHYQVHTQDFPGRNTYSQAYPNQRSNSNRSMVNSRGGGLPDILSPRRRLDTLFMVHSLVSIVVGVIGFVFPSTLKLVFTVEQGVHNRLQVFHDREYMVARAIYRPLCALILAQGLIIHRSRKINDGEIKRAFIQAYFVCFLLSTIGLIYEHASNSGVVSGKFLGIMKIFFMIGLTAGYGWFTFFQPPSVFQGLAMRRTL